MRKFALLILLAGLGCHHHSTPDAPAMTGDKNNEPPPPEFQHTVKIESDPPGMHAFFGTGAEIPNALRARGYVGVTPCEIKVPCDSDGCFQIEGIRFENSFHPPCAVFSCDPPADATNLFPQKSVFLSEAHFHPPDKVPDAVFFDMKKKPDDSQTNKPAK